MKYLMTLVCNWVFGNLNRQLDLCSYSVLDAEQESLQFIKGNFLNRHAEFENHSEFIFTINLF